jgi:hypothetical protein
MSETQNNEKFTTLNVGKFFWHSSVAEKDNYNVDSDNNLLTLKRGKFFIVLSF